MAAIARLPCQRSGARAAAPLEAYGELPSIEQIAISPSGKLLAIDITKGEQRNVLIQDVASRKIVTGFQAGTVKIRGLEWAGDGHLIDHRLGLRQGHRRRAHRRQRVVRRLPTTTWPTQQGLNVRCWATSTNGRAT